MTNKYSFQVAWSDEDNAYFASCPEFPGLLAHGDTPEEAIKEAGIALEGVIDVYKESDLQLPEPLTRQEYSGQFRLRLPKSLHRQAALIAEREGVSLNTFAATAIAEKVGAESAKKDAGVAINIGTVQLASSLTINAPGPGNVATTDSSGDQWGNYQLLTNPCRDQ
jgi:predicted RNase H-like HicB family nuclease